MRRASARVQRHDGQQHRRLHGHRVALDLGAAGLREDQRLAHGLHHVVGRQDQEDVQGSSSTCGPSPSRTSVKRRGGTAPAAGWEEALKRPAVSWNGERGLVAEPGEAALVEPAQVFLVAEPGVEVWQQVGVGGPHGELLRRGPGVRAAASTRWMPFGGEGFGNGVCASPWCSRLRAVPARSRHRNRTADRGAGQPLAGHAGRPGRRRRPRSRRVGRKSATRVRPALVRCAIRVTCVTAYASLKASDRARRGVGHRLAATSASPSATSLRCRPRCLQEPGLDAQVVGQAVGDVHVEGLSSGHGVAEEPGLPGNDREGQRALLADAAEGGARHVAGRPGRGGQLQGWRGRRPRRGRCVVSSEGPGDQRSR